MNIPTLSIALAIAYTLAIAPQAQSSLDPGAELVVGWVTLNCIGSSDTVVSPPLARPAVYVGEGTGANISVGVSGKITFVSASFETGQFKYVAGTQSNSYYAFVASGTKEGDYFSIVDNDATSITVALGGDTLEAVPAGTTVKIVPFWTLGTLFPQGDGIQGTSSAAPGTQILLPDTLSTGTNLTAVSYYYSSAAGMWLQSGTNGSANDTVLYPDNYLTVRNHASAVTTICVSGAVVASKLVIPLSTNQLARQDNFVGLMRPTPLTLDDSGLISSGAFAKSVGFTTGDQLFVFDNSIAQFNKAASKIYTYANGAWRRSGIAGDAGKEVVFTPGSGVIIRKARSTGANTAMWSLPSVVSN